MCIVLAPATIAAITAISSTTSAAAAVAGSVMAAQAQSNAAKYQQAQAENNAKIAKYQGQNAEREGELRADAIQRNVAATISSQRGGFAASGVSLGSGSSLALEVDTSRQGAMDLSLNAYNTAMKQWGFGVQAANYRAEAGAAGSAATNAWISGGIKATGSLLQGATQFSNLFGPPVSKP